MTGRGSRGNRRRRLPYIIGKELGSGSYGIVYEGRRPETGERVALKIFKEEVGKDVIKLERHNNEAVRKLLGRHGFLTRHGCENIILFLGEYVHSDGQRPVLVFEYAEGGNVLTHLYKKGLFSEAYTRDIIRGVLRGIARLHECRIMHRDIKPENILLKRRSSPSTAAVSDFGVSTYLENGGAKPFTSGTIAFSPPEAFKFRVVGRKGDIWGVGAVMHELLLGDLPYGTRETPVETMIDDIVTKKIDFSGKKYKVISSDGRDLLKMLLTKNPNHRPTALEAFRHPWFKTASVEMTFSAPKIGGSSLQGPLLKINAILSFLEARFGMRNRPKERDRRTLDRKYKVGRNNRSADMRLVHSPKGKSRLARRIRD